jgi:glutaredoxin
MITIYGKENCHWCQEARRLADRYQLKYEYKDTLFQNYRTEMFSRFPEAKTVPQIWWGDRHIGGYSEFASEIENTVGNYGQELF